MYISSLWWVYCTPYAPLCYGLAGSEPNSVGRLLFITPRGLCAVTLCAVCIRVLGTVCCVTCPLSMIRVKCTFLFLSVGAVHSFRPVVLFACCVPCNVFPVLWAMQVPFACCVLDTLCHVTFVIFGGPFTFPFYLCNALFCVVLGAMYCICPIVLRNIVCHDSCTIKCVPLFFVQFSWYRVLFVV